MTGEPKPLNPDTLVEAERLAREGSDREVILTFLRAKHFDKIDSIRTVRHLYGLSSQEAKDLIDKSATWSDRYEIDTAFHEMADRVFREIVASNDPDLPKFKP
jgi:ribosomal protein L7/L12